MDVERRAGWGGQGLERNNPVRPLPIRASGGMCMYFFSADLSEDRFAICLVIPGMYVYKTSKRPSLAISQHRSSSRAVLLKQQAAAAAAAAAAAGGPYICAYNKTDTDNGVVYVMLQAWCPLHCTGRPNC